MNTTSVLVLGNPRTREMRPVLDAVLDVFQHGDVRVLPVAAVLPGEPPAAVPPDRPPAIVVVCQSRPDEFTASDVYALIGLFPQARWVCCFGLWCESDGRNRDVWPVSVRVPARLARGRLLRERRALAGTTTPLPLTGGRDEAFEYDADSATEPAGTALVPPTACVLSPDRELRMRFEDDLRSGGRRIVASADDDPDGILFDADPWNDDAAATLRRLRRRHCRAAILGLMNFARPEDVDGVKAAGADAVLAKLATPADLLQSLAKWKKVQ